MRLTLAVTATLVASAALAHTGVMNPAVLTRMEVMDDAKKAVALLGDMAKGKTTFDADSAAQAQTMLVTAARKTPMVFEAPETDPKSEALPAIWTNWEDFVAKSAEMERQAAEMDVTTLDGLRGSLGALGKSCSNCHEDYRVKK